jgi:citrate lyase subunit beta/citryl-CoA lyase
MFAPDPEEVAFCRKVIESFKAAEATGSASITVDGIFVDYPIVDKAARIVALAERLAAKDAAAGGAAAAERTGR